MKSSPLKDNEELHDMRTTQSGRVVDGKVTLITKIGAPPIMVIALVAFTVTLYTVATASTSTDKIVDAFCAPNGKPYVKLKYGPSHDYNPHWDPALFLSVTLGFGDLNYGAARGIDVCWDLVVGGIGQVMLGILAYRVVRKSLRLRMERNSVHLNVYAALAFDQISPSALWATLKDTITIKSSRSSLSGFNIRWNWRYVGHALILTYILSFSRLVSVMTGYQAKYRPFIPHPNNGLLLDVAEFTTPDIVLIDGSRVGLHDHQPIFRSDPSFWTLLSCTPYQS